MDTILDRKIPRKQRSLVIVAGMKKRMTTKWKDIILTCVRTFSVKISCKLAISTTLPWILL